MLPLAIAARFLRSSLGQTGLIVAGIGVGIAVQIFVGSLITSLQADLIDSTVGSSPHVTLLPAEGDRLSGDRIDLARQQPEVSAAIPVRRLSAIHTSGDASTALSITASGADELDLVYRLADRIVAGNFSLAPGEIVIGTGFSEDAGIDVGDTLALILPDGATGQYTVTGIFDLGAAAANDRFAFLAPESAADALGFAGNEYSAIEIQVDDVFVSTAVAERLADDDLRVIDWQAENEELLSGLAAQSGSSFLIQAFVLIAVALGIASTLAISAVQKTRQIGILKAMGMTDSAAGGSSCCRPRSWAWEGSPPESGWATC